MQRPKPPTDLEWLCDRKSEDRYHQRLSEYLRYEERTERREVNLGPWGDGE